MWAMSPLNCHGSTRNCYVPGTTGTRLSRRRSHHRHVDSRQAGTCRQGLPGDHDGTGERQPMAVRQALDELLDQPDEFIAKLKREPEIRHEQRKPAWLPDPALPID